MKSTRYSDSKFLLSSMTGAIALLYLLACLFLFLRQRYLIFRPSPIITTLPSVPDFQLPYKDVWIPVSDSSDRLHSWWIPAPSPQEKFLPLPKESAKILKPPKVVISILSTTSKLLAYVLTSLSRS